MKTSRTMRPLDDDDLAAQTRWLRRLALALTRDGPSADDLVQDTWIAALRSPARIDGPVRPWLAGVIRNIARTSRRTMRRRSQREALAADTEPLPTQETLALRHEAYRLVGELVSQLPEPYRSTVLYCYGHGIPPTEIARRLGLPAGTVRRRLKYGLDQIRARLDERYQGNRRAWMAALLVGVDRPQHHPGSGAGSVALKLGALVAALGMIAGGARVLAPAHAPVARELPAASVAVLAPVFRRPPLAPAGDALPAWLPQPGAPARRVAGRVTFDGVPVAGARVLLAHDLGTRGALTPAEVASDARGRFDFGPQPPVRFWVAAATPERTMEHVLVDLRDPTEPTEAIELPLDACNHLVSGRVADASGVSIAGATIGLYRLLGTRSAADGSFQLCVPPGNARLRVAAAGYGTVELDVTATARLHRDITLVPHASVDGAAIDGVGAAVPGAVVVGRPSRVNPRDSHAASASVVADADGRFRLTGLHPGRWRFSATGPSLAAAVERELSVGSTPAPAPLILRLEPRLTLLGSVRERGQPVAGAAVRIEIPASGHQGEEAISQLDGSFTLQQVPEGDRRLVVEGYEVLTPRQLDLPLASTGRPLDIEVRRAASVRGRALYDGTAVPSTVVHLEDERGQRRDSWTRPDGSFAFPGLLPGRYLLLAVNDRVGAAARPRSVLVERGQAIDQLALNLELRGEIAGVVVDQHGKPVAAAWVELARTQPDTGSCGTDVDGRFACRMMAAGSYEPVVYLFQHNETQLPPAGGPFPAIQLAGDRTRVGGVILAVRFERLTIAGRVLDARGRPLADARVEAERLDGQAPPRFFRREYRPAVVTDVDGLFTLGPLLPGKYAVRAATSCGIEAMVTDVAGGARGLTVTVPAGER